MLKAKLYKWVCTKHGRSVPSFRLLALEIQKQTHCSSADSKGWQRKGEKCNHTLCIKEPGIFTAAFRLEPNNSLLYYLPILYLNFIFDFSYISFWANHFFNNLVLFMKSFLYTNTREERKGQQQILNFYSSSSLIITVSLLSL